MKEGHKVSVAHSGLARADRDREIDSFRKGDTDVLVLTDAEGQATDILQGNVMVNFDLPVYSDLSSEPLRGHLREEQYLKRMASQVHTRVGNCVTTSPCCDLFHSIWTIIGPAETRTPMT